MTEFSTFPPIYNILGIDEIEKLPILDIKNRMGGSTGYINFIHPNEMKYPIMRGKDIYNRSFIAIKVTVKDERNEDVPFEVVGTFFQRYCRNDKIWAYGTSYMMNTIHCKTKFHKSNNEYVDLEQRLRKLFNGETIRSIIEHQLEPVDYVVGQGTYLINLDQSLQLPTLKIDCVEQYPKIPQLEQESYLTKIYNYIFTSK